MSFIEFTVNQTKCRVDATVPRYTSLNAYLRYWRALPGTKAMCREGGCGACIVSVRALRHPSGNVETFSVNSCLVLVTSCHGWEITTIEGLGNRSVGYSEEQTRVAAFNATQCGYCTPGWVMHLHSLRDKHLTMAEMERAFASNTCRCTGFRSILDTVKSFAKDASVELCQRVKDIEDLSECKNKKKPCSKICSLISEDSDWCVIEDLHIKADETIVLNYGISKYVKVFSEKEIFNVLNQHGNDSYMLVDGNTGKGIKETFEYPNILIDISGVSSLKQYEFDQNLVLGANISIEDCKRIFKDAAAARSEFSYLAELVKHLELVAHIPVRKLGSLAGNLMLKHASPIYQSDIYLMLDCIAAMLIVRNASGQETYLNMSDFLKFNMQRMLIVKIMIPPLGKSHTFRSYKIMPRHQNSLAIVNAAFLVKINENHVIEKASVVYGNISPTFSHARKTEEFLSGINIFDNQTLQRAINVLNEELVPVPHPPEPSPECRKKLALGLFYKFILNICPSRLVSVRYKSGSILMERPVSSGKQVYKTDPAMYPINQPVPKLEANIQSAGEATYANDLPPMSREVFGAFVLSTIHMGELDHVDASEIMKISGVLAVLTAKDIPGKNSFTNATSLLLTEVEEILVDKQIKYYGQPVAIVVAESEELASLTAKKVKVTYKNVSSKPPVLTVNQAMRDSKRYVDTPFGLTPIGRGMNVKKVIKGIYEIDSQYHYFMEPLTCVVVPVDRGLEVYDSTQWMDLSQIAIAQTLNMNVSDVQIKVRRVGGGFGGKISRSAQVAAACALVAKKLDRPCRFVLPLQTNMAAIGKRLPMQMQYEVGVDNLGKIQYLDAHIIENKGWSVNESLFLLLTADSFKNCYSQEYYKLKVGMVLTDLPSNTYCRSPGTVEGISSIEYIMERIAFELKKDPIEVRLLNMTPMDNEVPEMLKTLKADCEYDERLKAVEKFNKENRWMKKAIVISVMKFPLSYLLNYSAMVSIYKGDGTVSVTMGGIEMGQGINTKAAQVCAYELGIPLEYITIVPSVTFAAANNMLSGSSLTTDSVCYAIVKACEILKARLLPVKLQMINPTWQELVKRAGVEQVDMTASFMASVQNLIAKSYSTFGVSAIETQLDVLTGKFEILRADILEDVGLSANPNIDVGQLEGAYIQGIGYYTSEKLVFDEKSGKLLTNRSLTYHVPLALDIPIDFRIKFKENSRNARGVLGAKAIGEMGMCLAQGVTHALRKCIHESRKESGYDPNQWIDIDIPCDTESILKALDVKLQEFHIS